MTDLGITPEERKIVHYLAACWNAFTLLPVEHKQDQAEFCQLIHAAQDKVLARAGRREINR
jgi:hypothetical protein